MFMLQEFLFLFYSNKGEKLKEDRLYPCSFIGMLGIFHWAVIKCCISAQNVRKLSEIDLHIMYESNVLLWITLL